MNTIATFKPVHRRMITTYLETDKDGLVIRENTSVYVGEIDECKGGFLKIVLSVAAAIVAPYAVPALAGVLGGSTIAAGALYGAAAGALSTGSLRGAVFGGIAGGFGGYAMGGGSNNFLGGGNSALTGGSSSVAPSGVGMFTGAQGSGLAQTAGTQLASSSPSIGSTGFWNGGAAGATNGPLLDVTGSGLTGGATNGPILDAGSALTGGSSSIAPSGVSAFTGSQSPWSTLKDSITSKIQDPQVVGALGKAVIGNLAPKPNYGYDAYGAQAKSLLDKQSQLADLQAAQYNKNVPGIQNQATEFASRNANPAFTAEQSVNDFKLGDANRRQEMHDQLTTAGYAPGSPQYTEAMDRLNLNSGLGRVQAYNSGYGVGVDKGMALYSGARNIHDVPAYGTAAAGYQAAGITAADVARRQQQDQNTAAGSLGDLFFPPNPNKPISKPAMA